MSNLVVAALATEMKAVEPVLLEAGDDLLITGPGKVNAAIGLTALLAKRLGHYDLVLNLGTAGALSSFAQKRKVMEVSYVTQGDFDTTALEVLTGTTYGGPIRLADLDPRKALLVTTDRFLTQQEKDRLQIKDGYDLCDMEAYAYAQTCRDLGVPFRCVKVTSDFTDDEALTAWPLAVETCSQMLADWYRDHMLG